MRPLYIYGPPASGKSTLARRLASAYGVEAPDLDARIVARIGMPIARFFAERGEAAFRDIESETLRATEAPVVALGGGTLLREANRAFAEERGFVVVLDVSDEEIARRIELAKGVRPLGNKAAERRAHYASFAHHVGAGARVVLPARLAGSVDAPASKSHLHRLLTASFLADASRQFAVCSLQFAAKGRAVVPDRRESGARGRAPSLQTANCKLQTPLECEDIAATRRCLAALAQARRDGADAATLDCGESGSTLRFLAPVAAALGVRATFVRRGRLAERPMIDYGGGLASGRHELPGDVSSQFVTGLLFALPLLAGDSELVFTSPLQSRGYVDMTLDVVRAFGIVIEETATGFRVPGGQRYVAPGDLAPEGDWSGAAFWFAANALGAAVDVRGVCDASRQPDRAVGELLRRIAEGNAEIDISPCPDLYPALAVAAAAAPGVTRFVNAARLRIKESDRIAAMEAVLRAFGVEADSTPDASRIVGALARPFAPCEIDARGDHRIAMAAAVAATRAAGPVVIHGAGCVAKSYPGFFEEYERLARGGAGVV